LPDALSTNGPPRIDSPTRKSFPRFRIGKSLGSTYRSGARAAGVDVAVDHERIPLLGFAQLTLVGAVLGVLLAVAVRLPE
jgi:hypothetical protein